MSGTVVGTNKKSPDRICSTATNGFYSKIKDDK